MCPKLYAMGMCQGRKVRSTHRKIGWIDGNCSSRKCVACPIYRINLVNNILVLAKTPRSDCIKLVGDVKLIDRVIALLEKCIKHRKGGTQHPGGCPRLRKFSPKDGRTKQVGRAGRVGHRSRSE